MVAPGESVPPKNPSTPSRLQPDCDNSNFYEIKPDPLTQNPPNIRPQYRCHMRPQQYVYRHYHNLQAQILRFLYILELSKSRSKTQNDGWKPMKKIGRNDISNVKFKGYTVCNRKRTSLAFQQCRTWLH